MVAIPAAPNAAACKPDMQAGRGHDPQRPGFQRLGHDALEGGLPKRLATRPRIRQY